MAAKSQKKAYAPHKTANISHWQAVKAISRKGQNNAERRLEGAEKNGGFP